MKSKSEATKQILGKGTIQFECQGSGKCCTSRGSYGYVYLNIADQKRMSGFLKLPLKDFRKSHCEKSNGYWHLKSPDKDCQFLSNKSCTVYEGRPNQCRTWPFWPENMSPKAWQKEVASFCPGVGKGKVFSAKEIKEILKANEASE